MTHLDSSPRYSLAKIILFIGGLQIIAYFFCASLASPGRHLAVPQPDTLLYCQSARQIVAGTPFVHTPGDKPNTGCTSHLYPFVLAIPYALGAQGPALITAGFFLNALFYLIFLFCWGTIIERLLQDSWAKWTATLLLALSGQPVFCALSQSDTGLFMALSAALFAALLTERHGLFSVLLILSPWCRPEGIPLIFFYAAALAIRRLFMRDAVAPREWVTAAAGIFSIIGVFGLNLTLTGDLQFHSVIFKTYFKQQPFLQALHMTLADAIRIAKELFLGAPYGLPRDAFFLPLLGAAMAWLGIFTRDWRRLSLWKELWWLAAATAALVSVAMSGWQNTNYDRYLAWLLPIWLVFIAEGVVFFARRMPRHTVAWLPLAVLIAYQTAGSLAFVSSYHRSCQTSQQEYDYALAAAPKLPAGARIGGVNCSLAYAWPGHRFVHLSGLYSPEFLTLYTITHLDKLKNEPAQRFDVWFFPASSRPMLAGLDVEPLYGQKLALSPNQASLRFARWDALDRARFPLELTTVTNGAPTLKLMDRLDVGYLADERRCNYRTGSRFHGVTYNPFGMQGSMGTNTIIDVGRAVIGWDEMTVRLAPGRDVTVKLRTTETVTVPVQGLILSQQTLSFDSPLRLRVHVNGVAQIPVSLPLNATSNDFDDVAFTIPGHAITAPATRLEIYGDRAVFGYGFYQ